MLRTRCNLRLSSRSPSARCVTAICSSSASSVKYARATSALSARRTVSRAASVASNSARAALLAPRSRPHKSSSYDTLSWARYALRSSALAGIGIGATSDDRVRSRCAVASTNGERCESATRHSARASSTRATASARSRLCSNASFTSASSALSL